MRLHHPVDDRQAEARAARAGREERIPRSLEDRRVKQFFAGLATGCICPPDLPVCACGNEPEAELLTRRSITAEEAELELNPRSRSARLRGALKITEGRP